VTSDHNLQYCHVTSFDKQRVIIGFNDEIIDVRYLPRGRVAVATNSPQVRDSAASFSNPSTVIAEDFAKRSVASDG
jgi:hypothetical protein